VGSTAGLVGEENGKTVAPIGVRTPNRPARSDLQYIPRYPHPTNKDLLSPFSKESKKRIDVQRCNIRIGTVFFCSALQIIFYAIRHIYDYSFVKSFQELGMFGRHRTITVISASHKFSHSFMFPVRESSG
jgi:hypothetical protein